ncbi:SGNH/GDSL hydrolase family protein [Candidatus Woesearchaeota archaeon]|nr:SGNH/GDSL hydrolase family protein [Candidatus Woesearchaeota archaeon]
MQRIKFVKVLGFSLIVVFILGVLTYFLADRYSEKLVKKGNTATEERQKVRIAVFKQQVLYLGIFLGVIGILMSLFSKNIEKFIKVRKNLFVNILFLIIFSIILLLMFEIILRIFFSNKIYKEYGFGPGNLEWAKKIKLNSLGYRDIQHSIAKQNGTFRILVFGDSYTMGSGIDNFDDVYARVLQKKLDESYGKGKFEMIILAKGGYSTINVLRDLRDIGLNMSPDLIVYGYYANDAEGPGSMNGYEKLFFHHYAMPYEAGYFLYQHSFAYYFFESRLKNLLRSLGFEDKSYADYIRHLYSDSDLFNEHKKYLIEFIRTSKENGVPVVIINIPVISDFNNYTFAYVNEYVKNVTLLNGGIYIELLPHFAKYGQEKLRVSFLDAHMNELGHNITAEVIFNEMMARGLVKGVKK